MLRKELVDCCHDLGAVRYRYLTCAEPHQKVVILLTYRVAEWKVLLEQARLGDICFMATTTEKMQTILLVQRGFQQLKDNLKVATGIDMSRLAQKVTGLLTETSSAEFHATDAQDFKKICSMLVLDILVCMHVFEFVIFQGDGGPKRNRIKRRQKHSHSFQDVAHWETVLAFLLRNVSGVLYGKPMLLKHVVGSDEVWGTEEESNNFEKSKHILPTILFEVIETPKNVLDRLLEEAIFPPAAPNFNGKALTKFMQDRWDQTIIEDDWSTYVPSN